MLAVVPGDGGLARPGVPGRVPEGTDLQLGNISVLSDLKDGLRSGGTMGVGRITAIAQESSL